MKRTDLSAGQIAHVKRCLRAGMSSYATADETGVPRSSVARIAGSVNPYGMYDRVQMWRTDVCFVDQVGPQMMAEFMKLK